MYCENAPNLSQQFKKSINNFLLTFKDKNAEMQYRMLHTDFFLTIKWLRVGFWVMFISIFLFRVYALVTFETASANTYKDRASIYFIFGLMVGTVICELIIFYIEKLKQLRGFVGLSCLYFTVNYLSHSLLTNKFYTIGTAFPYYLCCYIIGSFYIYNWMAAGISSVIGLISYIIYNHLHSGVYSDRFFSDTLFAIAYVVLAIYFYVMECRRRYEFYFMKMQSNVQESYKEFLINLPNGILILSEKNEVVFSNHIFEKLAREDEPTLSEEYPMEYFRNKDIMRILDEFKLMEKNQQEFSTLRENVEAWQQGSYFEERKYSYKTDGEEYIYSVKGVFTLFKSINCKALVFQDQTNADKLEKLNDRYKKLYVSSVAHDIRTPLNGIIGMLEMMNEMAETKELKQYLNVARKTSKLLLFLTYDITDYSQLEANKFKPVNTLTSIEDIMVEVSQLFSFTFERKGIKYLYEIIDPLPDSIYIDKNRYMQILINLVGNAQKFTSSGSVTTTVKYDEKNDTLITDVKDTGVGISTDEIPKLFRLYGKLESTSSLNPQGVGFGLFICKAISESLGGYIYANSRLGLGSIFTFGIKANSGLIAPGDIKRSERSSLDLDKYNKFANTETISAASNSNGKPPMTRSSRKILIVDDDQSSLYVMKSYLKIFNLTADEATNGKEAVEKVVALAANSSFANYDLVIMDVNMPIMNGIESSRMIKQKMDAKKIPFTTVVALTGDLLSENELQEFYKNSGYTDYLFKPTTKNEFAKLLKNHKLIA